MFEYSSSGYKCRVFSVTNVFSVPTLLHNSVHITDFGYTIHVKYMAYNKLSVFKRTMYYI